MNLLWIEVRGVHLRSQNLTVPLSPASELMWLGLSDVGSPTIMDADDVIKIYDKKSCLWRVACDTNIQVRNILFIEFLMLYGVLVNKDFTLG